MKRAKTLVTAGAYSVGRRKAPEAARIELKNLLSDMDVDASRMEELIQRIERKSGRKFHISITCWQSRIGLVMVSGFIAEVENIGRFDNPK